MPLLQTKYFTLNAPKFKYFSGQVLQKYFTVNAAKYFRPGMSNSVILVEAAGFSMFQYTMETGCQ